MKLFFRIFGLALLVIVLALVAFRVAASLRETSTEVPDVGRMIATSKGQVYVEDLGETFYPPVLMIHGSVGWSRLWVETAHALRDEGYRTISFDMAPMGFSERRMGDDYSRQSQAERVLALVEALEVKPILVAHSFGAGAGTEAVMMNPNAFAGFVIVDGAIGVGAEPKALPWPLRFGFIRELAVSITVTNPLLTRKLLQMFIYRKDRATPDYVRIIQEPFSREGTTAAMADWLPTLLVPPVDVASTKRSAYGDLNLPVGIIWGAEDTTTPPAQGEELLGLIPGAQMMVMPGIGHIPQIEDPAAFQAALIEMLGAF